VESKCRGAGVENEYIKQLYIQYGDKHILLDTGFRGEKAQVLEESGLFYTNKDLKFHERAKRYLCEEGSRYSTRRNKPATDKLPALVRNVINFAVENKENKSILNVAVQNVNEHNLQPCNININCGEISLTKNAKGCLADRKYAVVCTLDNVKSTTPLEEPSLEQLKNIPSLEVAPEEQNEKWN
jgi:hypothetical protein